MWGVNPIAVGKYISYICGWKATSRAVCVTELRGAIGNIKTLSVAQ